MTAGKVFSRLDADISKNAADHLKLAFPAFLPVMDCVTLSEWDGKFSARFLLSLVYVHFTSQALLAL